jgi:hypothetical protein
MKKAKKIVSKSFNRKKIYDKEIRPLVDTLHDLCLKHKIIHGFITAYSVNKIGASGQVVMGNFKDAPRLPDELLNVLTAINNV